MKTTRATRAVKPTKKAASSQGASTPAKGGSSPKVGGPAPSFSLPAAHGDETSLADHKGKWVVLYFYPKDHAPGCTRQAIAFEGATAALKKRGAVVFGVSRDSVKSHCGFKEKQG